MDIGVPLKKFVIDEAVQKIAIVGYQARDNQRVASDFLIIAAKQY
jgi:hypothetical protein